MNYKNKYNYIQVNLIGEKKTKDLPIYLEGKKPCSDLMVKICICESELKSIHSQRSKCVLIEAGEITKGRR